ncbi:hypothetical protein YASMINEVIRUS_150 [Yasminevirus sp. GU-2018]|uniref:Aminopeptidase N n=1 Tax=Yasminevirus sp. GU-2018 TaxID=2420051 RepID=A0A5K0U7F6_9VIRU|nr:hypothetical protein YASMINEVIRUS_150 [Yasminevirus sp. GU-2018]
MTDIASSSQTSASTHSTEVTEKKHLITDYVKTKYFVPETVLDFDIHDDHTIVTATYTVTPVKTETGSDIVTNLVLNGDASVELLTITCEGKDVPYEFVEELAEKNVVIGAETVKSLLAKEGKFVLTVQCKIHPETNTELQGLYLSNNTYCTQCESHGFRRIVYSFDRPDVLSKYTVKITADKKKCPVILSNGNQTVGLTECSNDRHYVVWTDPHPKPSYLFALVAGDLGHIESKYLINGDTSRPVTLRIYAPHNKISQLDHAMYSIIESMKWDEKRYGLCYDLDLFNIVCLDDFNMGAMENKGLNIFNSKYVLATPSTATDTEHELVTGVIGHEYFHNWTGDRVTLEKWFDLTLKEGLTVFRDQNFSMDVGASRDQQIIDRAIDLRNGQFQEDEGPNAHPIRPRSYKVMDNFYTSTVYEKGAEVIRAYESLLGVDGFRKGMDLYFKRHDGTAVACEDFWQAMFDANITSDETRDKYATPMRRLFNWYHQAGTPQVKLMFEWDVNAMQFIVNCSQTNPRCVELNGTYEPVLIPIRFALIDRVTKKTLHEQVFNFCELEQTFVVQNVDTDCVPSFMRDFSAPVTTSYDMPMEDRLFLMSHDSNMFNRWEQSQIIHKKYMIELYKGDTSNFERYAEVLSGILTDEKLDPSLKSSMVSLPCQDEMISSIPDCDPIRLHNVGRKIDEELSARCREYLVQQTDRLLDTLPTVKYALTKEQMAERELFRSLTRLRLAKYNSDDSKFVTRVFDFAINSDNLTNRVSCITALSHAQDPDGSIRVVLDNLLDRIAQMYIGDILMTSKWLRYVARVPSSNTVTVLTQLFKGSHPRSSMVSKTTPNHLYALVLAFTANPFVHEIITNEDGSTFAPGYEYITDCLLEVDTYNGIVSSRIAGLFDNIKQLSPQHREHMQKCIDRIKAFDKLSENVREVLH